ncbi:uncharacterized protein J3R85_012366 [Psidium guajava]|nr:uncharacterized protein J3R85_012366 [Psidium guajava]
MEEAYDSCNTSAAISVYTRSPVKYTLTTAGEYFFTSTYAHHCFLGQKLAINVAASSSATPPCTPTAPTPSSNPSSPAPSPMAGGPSAPPPRKLGSR